MFGKFEFDQTLIAARLQVCFILIDINKLGPFHGQNKLDSRKSNHGLNRYVESDSKKVDSHFRAGLYLVIYSVSGYSKCGFWMLYGFNAS